MDIVCIRDPLAREALRADAELQGCLGIVECVQARIDVLGLRVDAWDVVLHGSYSQTFSGCCEAFAAAREKLDKFVREW